MDDSHEKLELVRVTRNDFEKVLSIRDIEEDYLPYYFYRLVDSKNTMAFAASVEDTFIAFAIAFIVDCGTTCIRRSLRVAKKFEGRGVMRWLLEKMDEIILKTTAVEYITSVSESNNLHLQKQIIQGSGYNAVKRKMKRFRIEKHVLKDVLQNVNVPMFVQVQCVHDLLKISSNKELSKILFREERLVIDWVPFRNLKDNITNILQETTIIIGSQMDHVDEALLTFSHQFPKAKGRLYFIDVYGNIGKNLPLHVLKHLEKCVDTDCKIIDVCVFFNNGSNIEVFDDAMRNVNFSLLDLSYEGIIVVEKQVRKKRNSQERRCLSSKLSKDSD